MMSGVVLQRAASAVVHFCEHHRNQWKDKVEAAEKMKAGGSGSSEVSFTGNPEEFLRDVEIVDTVLLSALLNCSPPRRNAVVDLLSHNNPVNRCHMESSTALIASQGNAFTEALLWLYRSHNEHKRVLVALTEDRCVGQAAWNREQFYNWTADYLRWLWCSDDIGLPVQALNALRPVLEYDAELGLNVLTSRPKQSKFSVIGGKDVDIHDILTFLESVRLKPLPKGSFGLTVSNNLRRSSAISTNSFGLPVGSSDDAPFLKIPLTNGRALGITYLEWRVNNGTAPSASHNDYAQLLMEGIPLDIVFDHNSNSLEIKPTDDDAITLYKIYRKKLQYFLQTSTEYNPEKILKFLPSQFLHEYSLILSKLGKHEEVLKIYINQMKDLQIAESYCDRIYKRSVEERNNVKVKSSIRHQNSFAINLTEEENVYLILIKVLFSSSEQLKSNINNININNYKKKIINLDIIINIAERFYDRIDTIAFLNELPKNVPVAIIGKYLNIVLEYLNNSNKNLQIIHQLLRVREVNIRTSANLPNIS